MKITSPLEQKVKVKPIMFTMNHTEAYMGPCRYGQGYQLTYEYDVETANKGFEIFKAETLPELDTSKCELLEPSMLVWHQDFILKHAIFEEAMAQDNEVDLYLIYGFRLSQHFAAELGKRTNKAVALMPNPRSFSLTEHVDMSAALLAAGKKNVYPCLDTKDVNNAISIIRAQKVLANTRVLYPFKDGAHSYGCLSSFTSLEAVTERFGVQFNTPEFYEIFKEIDHLTDEEKQEAMDLADDLVKRAKGVHMPPENIIKDTEFYVATKKMLNAKDCNAFTIKCFEICATQELNRRKLTFCLTHSLLKDEKISSSCAGDVCSIVTMYMLMAIADKAPFMGNTMVINRDNNQCKILHDVPSRKMKGYDKEDLPIEYVAFTMDNWGTTMRYDFSQDNGETITLINLSPDMKRMQITKGTINGCTDYLTPECKLAMTFKVNNVDKFMKQQKYVGHHFACVIGDYSEQLEKLGEACGLEVMMS